MSVTATRPQCLENPPSRTHRRDGRPAPATWIRLSSPIPDRPPGPPAVLGRGAGSELRCLTLVGGDSTGRSRNRQCPGPAEQSP